MQVTEDDLGRMARRHESDLDQTWNKGFACGVLFCCIVAVLICAAESII